MHSVSLLLQRIITITIFIILLCTRAAEAQYFLGFYSRSCPRAELIVKGVVRLALLRDPSIAGSLLRLHFHDCFVLGCDASILLDDASGFGTSEKKAPPNLTLRGYEVIDIIKSILEAICPATVSCADILALAARDSVFLSGGPNWQVPTGRRDGRISSARLASLNLPLPSFNASQLVQSFVAHGLSLEEMITLSGAHTIGMAHCFTFKNRLYAFNSTMETDPNMDTEYADMLKQMCPHDGDPNKRVPMDPESPLRFDISYYNNLGKGRGLLVSDQELHNNIFTRAFIVSNVKNSTLWADRFVKAMIHMSSLTIQTGTHGEIRRNCRLRNP